MKAIRVEKLGGPEVMKLDDIAPIATRSYVATLPSTFLAEFADEILRRD